MSKGLAGWMVLALLGAATPSFAQQTPPPTPAEAPAQPAQSVPWSSLSADQQKLLGKFSDNWNTLTPARSGPNCDNSTVGRLRRQRQRRIAAEPKR